MGRDALRALEAKGLRLAVAESCTGGLLGATLTAQPGASRSFLGGVVAYANEAKQALLSVPPDVLLSDGAVSAACAQAMAAGVRKALGADVGLAVTGIAGPEGGTAAKPVGTVWLGIATRDGTRSERHQFEGGREQVRRQAVEAALALLRAELEVL